MNFIQEIDNYLVEISWFLDDITTCQKQKHDNPTDGLPYFENRESCGLRVAAYMHDDTPKVVAIAVNTVMTMLRILPQSDLFSIV